MVVFLSIDTPLSQPLSLPTVFAEIRTAFHKNMCQFYVTHIYIYIYKYDNGDINIKTWHFFEKLCSVSAMHFAL